MPGSNRLFTDPGGCDPDVSGVCDSRHRYGTFWNNSTTLDPKSISNYKKDLEILIQAALPLTASGFYRISFNRMDDFVYFQLLHDCWCRNFNSTGHPARPAARSSSRRSSYTLHTAVKSLNSSFLHGILAANRSTRFPPSATFYDFSDPPTKPMYRACA